MPVHEVCAWGHIYRAAAIVVGVAAPMVPAPNPAPSSSLARLSSASEPCPPAPEVEESPGGHAGDFHPSQLEEGSGAGQGPAGMSRSPSVELSAVSGLQWLHRELWQLL